jgi:hypothetical protein
MHWPTGDLVSRSSESLPLDPLPPRNCCLSVRKRTNTRSLVLINIYVCENRMTHIFDCLRVEGLPTPTSPHNPNRLKAILYVKVQ